jgi:DivIVA domain-containing protein
MLEFSPDAIAQRSFRAALRGFDQSEVREFLAQLAESVAALAAERDQLAATTQVADTADLKQEIEVVSKEIHSVLEAARSAAETMRERAASESARWRSEAISEAEKTRREAEVDAEHLRTDAWTTSETLISQAQREADRIRGETEKESMRLVGEAEREAHRTLGAGRREAEEALRSARMEAEKLVLDARASHDEIIETANRKAEVAQERTRALEERRDELRRELDSVRAAIASVESELDERREALSFAEPPPEPQPSAPEDGGVWVPGETVRVVRPGHGESKTGELGVISEPRPRPDPTPELRVLSPEEVRSRQQPAVPSPAAPPVDDLRDDLLGVIDEPADVVEVHEPDPAPEPEPAPVDEPEPVDSVEGIFARLREPVVAVPLERPDAPAPLPEPSAPILTIDPFDVRDALLLPVSNRALRSVKRQLTEAQNEALEAIRLDENSWILDAAPLEAGLRPDLVVLAGESFAAGHAAAEQLTDTKLARPATPADPATGGFAAALSAELARALADGRAHDHGARELASDVSRVFRAWRTDESERRLRHMSQAAFHSGLVASLGDVPLRWVVAGRGCAVCRDLGGRDQVSDVPPAHDGCACTIVPVRR